MALAGMTVMGRAFAVWPATLQVMPEGILDVGFGRFFVGVRIANASAQAWPATEIRISPRGRRILEVVGVSVSDGWTSADGAAVAQSAAGEWIAMPAVAAGGNRTIFLKLDVSEATPGLHALELELRDPAAPATTVKASAALLIAKTLCHGSQRAFTSTCDEGTLTASVSAVGVDQESFRRVLGQARVLAGATAQGVRTPAENERLRLRLRGLLCGEESDVCSVLSDLTSSCALPLGLPSGSTAAPGPAATIISDQLSDLRDRVTVTDGSVLSNHSVSIGTDAVINGDLNSGGDVQIGDRTRVQGNVSAAGIIKTNASGGVMITGTQTQHASFTPITIPTKTVTPGTTNITVNSGQGTTASPFNIAPGNYASITVNSNNVIGLSAGVYQVNQLVINADVTVNLNQTATSVDVRVQTNLSFGDRMIVKGGLSSPGTVAQFYSSQASEVRIGTDIAALPVALTVPNGTIHVYSRTTVLGQLAGKTVTLEPDVKVGGTSVVSWLGSGASGLELLAYPTGVDYCVTYNGGYFGSTGPLAFGAIPWRALLANVALQIDLGLPGAVAEDLVAIADQAVVGTTKTVVLNAPTTAPVTPPPSSQAGSVDAAVATLRGNRALGFPVFAQLDAATGEPNLAPINTLDGVFLSAGFMTNAEIDAALASGNAANLKVQKSGAGTGVTHGLISALLPVVPRDDESGTLQFINQILIVPDPDAPAADGKVAGLGDSGSLWIQTSTNKVAALTHTVGLSGTVASRIQDVVNALQIQLA